MRNQCSSDWLVTPPSSLTRQEFAGDIKSHELRYSQDHWKQWNNLLNYGKAENRLAHELGMFDRIAKEHPEWTEKQVKFAAKDEARALINKYFDRVPGAAAFIQGTYRKVADTKYVESLLGRRRWLRDVMDWDIQELHTYRAQRDGRQLCWCGECKLSRNADRQSVNTIIQGCLPGSTRVLTQKGMLPIGSIPDFGMVWTGSCWSKYAKLNRGVYERAEIELSNGQILQCDARHKVLTVCENGYEFTNWESIQPGTKVCLSLPLPIDFEGPAHKALNATHSYWLGFFVGNGSSSSGENHKNAMTVTFGDRKGRYSKEGKSQEFVKYIKECGHTTQKPRIKENKISITVESSTFKDSLISVGYPWGSIHEEKVVPTHIWSSNLQARTAFLLGLLDSDGYIGGSCPSLHMSAEHLLREVQILSRTIGVGSRLNGPYEQDGHISWRLDFNKVQLSNIGYGYGKKLFSMNSAPQFLVKMFVNHMRGKTVERGSDSTILSRMKKGGSTSILNMKKLCDKYELDTPIYDSAEVVSKRTLGFKEVTFTLSVDDPTHRFDSEGVISKNTAADVVMVAMINCDNDVRLKELGAKMLLQIHDEIMFEVPEEHLEEAMEIIQWHMEHPPVDLKVPLRAEPGVGDNWIEAK